MYQLIGDFKTALILSILSGSAAQYPTVPPVGPCATVRCGFNTKCIEFNGTAGCFNTTCSSGEIFTECSSYCEPTCIPQNIACIQSCGPPSCQCMPGFVRDNGVCVDPRLCSNIGPTTPSYVDEPVTPVLTSCDQALVRILCVTGTHCEIVNGTPQCVPDAGRIPRCADVRVKCAAGNHCENTPTGITCAPDPGRRLYNNSCLCYQRYHLSLFCQRRIQHMCIGLYEVITQWEGHVLHSACQPSANARADSYVKGQCIDPNTCPNIQKVSTTTLSYVDEPVTPLLTSCNQALILIQCVTGFHCEIVDGRPQCVPDGVPDA
ncbi:trypsin Inhibitor like cysteine rich domain protein, partial [Ostertagia ostertagi]